MFKNRLYHKKIDQFSFFKNILSQSYKILPLINNCLPKVSYLNILHCIFKKKKEIVEQKS